MPDQLNSGGNADETNRVPTPDQQGTRETISFTLEELNKPATMTMVIKYTPHLAPYLYHVELVVGDSVEGCGSAETMDMALSIGKELWDGIYRA